MRAVHSLVFATLLAAPSLANVIVVSPTGPVTSIQNAVNVAVDGDVILVKSGSYTGFEIASKSVTVVADAGASVLVTGTVYVHGVGATREVLLSGLDVVGSTASAASAHGLRLEQDAGSVRVVDCTLRGVFPLPLSCATGVGADVATSLDVAFVGCALFGASSTSPLEAQGGVALHALSANVALFDCALEGGDSGTEGACLYSDTNYGDGFDGAEAARLSNTTLFASGTSFHGGDGGDTIPTAGPGYAGVGASAIVASGFGTHPGDVHLLDGTVVSGVGGSAPPGSFPGGSLPPTRIFAPTTLELLPGTALHLDVPRIARAGTDVPVTLTGSAGDVAGLVMTTTGQWSYEPAFSGVRLTRTAPIRFLRLGQAPGSGVLAMALHPPPFPPRTLESTYHIQSLHRDLGGNLRLGPERMLVVVDPSY